MRVRVGINGFSPVGRAVLRAVVERDDGALEVVAVNDPGPARTPAHLLRHDSPHGRWNVEIEVPARTDDARTVVRVLPELAGKLGGFALHVPMQDVALIELTVALDQPAAVGQVDRAFAVAAEGYLADTLRHTTEPLVSHDVPRACWTPA